MINDIERSRLVTKEMHEFLYRVLNPGKEWNTYAGRGRHFLWLKDTIEKYLTVDKKIKKRVGALAKSLKEELGGTVATRKAFAVSVIADAAAETLRYIIPLYEKFNIVEKPNLPWPKWPANDASQAEFDVYNAAWRKIKATDDAYHESVAAKMPLIEPILNSKMRQLTVAARKTSDELNFKFS